ncbi:SRPBCC family protein [Aeromicrobium phragmitis]|nr:SRPBCC family protein [Aeromicrobium phragmitis]
MKLEHAFDIPVDTETAWSALLDIEEVARCFPGAVLDSLEGDTFTGSVKVKVGPIVITYQGSASFTSKDEAGKQIELSASGRDTKGSGTANAVVHAHVRDLGRATTRVELVTDLAVTGKAAQFGRGVMKEVSDKILGQFADNLAARLGAAGSSTAADAQGGEGSLDLVRVVALPLIKRFGPIVLLGAIAAVVWARRRR